MISMGANDRIERAAGRGARTSTDNAAMDLDASTPLLGGLSPKRFMRRHWQKRPLLARAAWPGVVPPADFATLRALAARDDVESRLVEQRPDGRWRLRHGPLRALPPQRRPALSLLLQGLDLHLPGAHEMLQRFAFVPHARLDDLMVSWASDGGGVGPHLDSYDVFLLQLQGRRRWRVGRVADAAWQPGQPLRLLQHFEPEHDWVLDPGDLLYLPPRWGHDGVAEGGSCMTASIGFRAPARDELARELLGRLAEGLDDDPQPRLYADPSQPATGRPGQLPPALLDFAIDAVTRAARSPAALRQALGEWLSEPKPQVWFEAVPSTPRGRGGSALAGGVRLDARSRMLYDGTQLFVNGESFRVGGADRRLLQRLADDRRLSGGDCARLSADAIAALDAWCAAGWLHRDGTGGP
jgi:50S ribosomal protein L16 3-hydroxylase